MDFALIDLAFIRSVLPMYGAAAALTIRIAAIGCVLAFAVALLCAAVRHLKVPVLRQIAGAYVELSRNTPLLVQLFFLYFGLPKVGLHLSSQTCAIAGLTFLGGSYMAEALRSGLEAVEKIQWESAAGLGLTRFQSLRFIIVPQALAVAVPAICANVIFLIKETSVFSVVALADLMYVAKDLIGLYYKTGESLFLLVVFYLILLLPVSLLAAYIERRARHGGFSRIA